MNPHAVIAWTSLYLAVGMAAMICAVLAFIVTILEIRTGAWRPSLRSRRDIALALPKLWLRWQRNHLFGAPVVLLIAIAFANHLSFVTFWAVEPND